MELDNLPKEKIMQFYQDKGIVMGLELAKVDIDERIKSVEKGIKVFLKDNDVTEDSVLEMD